MRVLSQNSIFGQNPKIGCQEFNGLQTPKLSKKQLCDRTVWDQQKHAEAYARGPSPQVLQAVTKVVEGMPQVSTSEMANSTFHTIAASVAT